MADSDPTPIGPVVPVIDEAAMREKIKADLLKDLASDKAEADKAKTHFILPDLPKSWTLAIMVIVGFILVLRGNLTAKQLIEGIGTLGGRGRFTAGHNDGNNQGHKDREWAESARDSSNDGSRSNASDSG